VIYDKPYILVIDDDPDILEAIRAMLEDEGCHVQTSEKGDYAEALRDLAGGLPDLIILDVLLSGKDGRAICRKLKEQDETRHIPVIMISAHPDAERSVKDVGADAFVAKPFSIDEFLDLVDGLLDGSPRDVDSR
jgi:DNA-binding response OmpR family regulator